MRGSGWHLIQVPSPPELPPCGDATGELRRRGASRPVSASIPESLQAHTTDTPRHRHGFTWYSFSGPPSRRRTPPATHSSLQHSHMVSSYLASSSLVSSIRPSPLPVICLLEINQQPGSSCFLPPPPSSSATRYKREEKRPTPDSSLMQSRLGHNQPNPRPPPPASTKEEKVAYYKSAPNANGSGSVCVYMLCVGDACLCPAKKPLV